MVRGEWRSQPLRTITPADNPHYSKEFSVQNASGGAAPLAGGLPYKWIVLLVVMIGAFMSILDQTIVNIAIPRLETAFGADLNGVQWVLTAYILTQGVVTPTGAFFADRLGTKRSYAIALALFTLGSALCGLASSLPMLIAFRVFQGIGGAFLFPLSIAMVFREFPPYQRGLASGLFAVAALLAPAIGPTLGGYFVTYADWPLIFFVNVPIGIVGVTLAALLLREARSDARLPFDLPGFLLAGAGLASVLYGLSDASTDGWGAAKVLAALGSGVILLAAFVAVELNLAHRGKQPLLDLRLFANGPFLASNVTNVLATFAFFGGIFLFPVYLQSLRGLNAFESGVLLLPQAFAALFTALVGGRIVDRYGARVVVAPGLVLLALASWRLTSLTLDTSYGTLEVLFVLRGLGLGMIIQPLLVASLSAIPPRQFAQASSLNTVLRFVSTTLGIAVLATLVQSRAPVYAAQLSQPAVMASVLARTSAGASAPLIRPVADPPALATAAELAKVIGRQASLLAIQDAFWLILAVLLVSVLAAGFVRMGQPVPVVTSSDGRNPAAREERRAAIVLE
jgi:DHA2 family multidrug resistance protein